MKRVRVCFCGGSSSSGSWKIRARQVSDMRSGWSCRPRLTAADILEHDVFCFIKRIEPRRMAFLRKLGKVVVYDVVDCWQQPEDDERCDTLEKVRRHFEEHFADLPADGVVFPNRTMYEDFGRLVPNPTFIYHHYRPGTVPISVRERPLLVGYEGNPQYLGPWRDVIEQACREHGLSFVVNPERYSDLDIGFAARGGRHGSLLSTRYKSNVKMANFYGAGLPCLVHEQEQSCREMDDPHIRFFGTEEDLRRGLASLLPGETRRVIHQAFLARRGQFAIERITETYEQYLEELAAQARAARTPRLAAA